MGIERALTPRVILASEFLRTLSLWLATSVRVRQGKEDGCQLLARWQVRGSGDRLIEIRGLIPAGPRSHATAGSLVMDPAAEGRLVELAQFLEPQTGFGGTIHVHPAEFARLSGTDIRTAQAAAREANTQELLYALVVPRVRPRTDNGNGKGHFIKLGGRLFEVIFYYVGLDSDFDAVRIDVTVGSNAGIYVGERLLRYADREGLVAAMDLKFLPVVPDFTVEFCAARFCLAMTDCIWARCTVQEFELVLLPRRACGAPPHVFLNAFGKTVQLLVDRIWTRYMPLAVLIEELGARVRARGAARFVRHRIARI